MTTSFIGRTARIPSGVRPSIRLASSPIPLIFPVLFSMAATDLTLKTMPSPLTYMRVLAVPRSTAISFAGNQDIQFMWGTFIEEPLSTWVVKVNARSCPANPAASESTRASRCRWQIINRAEGHSLHPRDYHLGDAHTPYHPERVGPQIDQRHHELAPVIAVDRRRSVRQ